MTNQPTLLLIYGRDATLLETRGWVFQQAGFKVLLVREPEEFERCVFVASVELVILCHTLSYEERDAALAAITRRRPELKALLLTPHAGPCAPADKAPTVSTWDGPRAMIAAATTMLGLPVTPSEKKRD